MRPDGPRPTIIGPDSGPEPPFPLRMKGKVVKGFGRGSKEVRHTFPISLLFSSLYQLKLSYLLVPLLYSSAIIVSSAGSHPNTSLNLRNREEC